ncbi:MAG: glycosyltransferase family 2 protein [Chloroflexota bacterium]|nr:MAG: glycosyltransferase family 2 protein [Chloroflexota bacterium]
MEQSASESILAVIPAYNESRQIGSVIQLASKYLPILVVDDGSIDDTAQIAENHGVQVYRQVTNQGKGAALREAFRHAIGSSFAAVVTLDADGQHDPEDIPAFIQTYRDTRADLIIGARDFSQIPGIRRMANTLGRWSFSWAVGQPIMDNQSGYRLITSRMMAAVLESKEKGFEFEVEMIVTCIREGYQLEWVPIRTIYAGEGSHIQPLKHTIEFTRMVLETKRRMRER